MPSAAPVADLRALPAGLTRERMPQHVAIIMDGNGRWAQQRMRPRIWGHRQGARRVRPLVLEADRLGIRYLTLYSFSVENWKRPAAEVAGLMGLYARYLRAERIELHRNDVRLRLVGKRDGLPDRVLKELDETERVTANNRGLTLCLAINYGGRDEIINACRKLAQQARAGLLSPESINDAAFESELYTAGIPDPDLLIRTAGEQRISNFLLWQLSYTEIFVTDVLWPEFGAEQLHVALRDYARRERRFGAVRPPTPSAR